jgi:excisionase family DNA binding protein
MPDELLTVPEAAQRLKVNAETVRRWLREGVLTGVKLGKRQWRVRTSDLERLSSPPTSAGKSA